MGGRTRTKTCFAYNNSEMSDLRVMVLCLRGASRLVRAKTASTQGTCILLAPELSKSMPLILASDAAKAGRLSAAVDCVAVAVLTPVPTKKLISR